MTKFLKLPQHIAIIMDGNGRWAQARNLPRTQGHAEGIKRVEEIIDACCDLGIPVLTVYAFSTENWTRPQNEISMLMKMLMVVLQSKVRKLSDKNIRVRFIGKRQGIPEEVLKSILKAEETTQSNSGLTVNVAFNYGGRSEILDAFDTLIRAVEEKKMKREDITEEKFGEYLYTKGLPDPDLLIRTSGEQRISNFLLWQLSYAEFYFTETFWPDFNQQEFEKALMEFEKRNRRYGSVRP